MPGPQPKPSHMRQRRNKTTTRAKLPAPARKARAPKLPKLPARGRGRGAWHPRVRAWWTDVWKSPMASEYLDVHRHGLEALAELRQQFHTAEEPGKIAALHAEIRHSQRDYGLTPLDLRRLQWEVRRAVDSTDAVVAAETQSPEKESKRRPGQKKGDPRILLRVVK